MKKFRVYALYTASKFVGEFEGETEQEAIAAAEAESDAWASLCHQCSREIEIGDCHDFEADEI